MEAAHLFAEVLLRTLLFSYTISIGVLSELRTLEPILPPLQQHVAGGVNSAGHLWEPVPRSTCLPLIHAKDMDRLTKPHLLSDDDWKDRDGKVRAKDGGEQASFSAPVQSSAQNVTENHSLPLLGNGFFWEYIGQL